MVVSKKTRNKGLGRGASIAAGSWLGWLEPLAVWQVLLALGKPVSKMASRWQSLAVVGRPLYAARAAVRHYTLAADINP